MARVLIVDDAKFMRMMVRDVVEKAGHDVVGEAENGIKAIEQYKLTNPDIVFMDITMADMDGIEAVRNIVAFDKDARIVMCSAMGQQSMVMDAIRAGAKNFIVKPFKGDKILECLNNHAR